MAAYGQPRAGGSGFDSISGDASGNGQTTSKSSSSQRTTEKLKWAGSIAGGILIGAAAAFLVAGILGAHETGAGAAQVSGSILQSSSNQ
jgi:hypothetical protein